MDCVTALLTAIMRRLYSCPAAAEYLLSLANAVVAACPSRVRAEFLHQLWDTCLRWVAGPRGWGAISEEQGRGKNGEGGGEGENRGKGGKDGGNGGGKGEEERKGGREQYCSNFGELA